MYANKWGADMLFWGDKTAASDTKEKRRLLSIFSVSEIVENHLMERMIERFYAKDAVVISEGEFGNSMFFVATGTLTVLKRDKIGQSIQIATMQPGDFFGEISLLGNMPRSSTVIANEQCKLFEIEKKAALTFLITKTPNLKARLKEACRRRIENDLLKLGIAVHDGK